jgi:addiction module HigA family antidote
LKLQSVDLRVADVEATARFFADVWGLTRVGSNRLRGSDALPYLAGRSGVNPEMAVRLSIAFGTSAESWLNHQVQHDLWHAEQRRKALKVVKLAA